MNTDELESALMRAELRVLEIQTKLHRWARDDPHRRFDDLFNLVADPAFLLVAWDRVRGNKGARTAGVDGRTAVSIQVGQGVEEFLDWLRSALKDRSFRPLPVRERMIPKANGKMRRLGIATITDRVVQASLKLVLEPIWESDFLPCSYGFRPNRRTHDAVAEVRFLATRNYQWIVEGDIKACFDEISHSSLMDRVRQRVGDKRVLALVKAFLKADILGEDRRLRENYAGTPQGSILSPLLSNVALSVLDEHIAHGPGGPGINRLEAAKRRRRGLANYRLVRYADDWCLAVFGTKAQAEALREEIAQVLSGMGLRLSQEKTLITHIDEGQDFLGWRIQRHRKPGTNRHYVYTYPAEEGPTGRQSEGQDPVPAGRNEPAARHPAAPTQPGAAGLERPLPIRGVLRNLQLPRLLHVADGLAMAATQTPPGDVEADPPPLLRRWMVAIQRQQGTVQPGRGGHRPLPLPGHDHSQPLANHRMRTNTTQPTRGLWRAGCRANRHVRFGKRPEETDRSKDRHRASGRLHRLGARQVSVTIAVEGDGLYLTGEQWAEAAFTASNHPSEAPAGPARAIQLALAEQVRGRLRSLSTGDTVTVHGQMWACESVGWRRIDTRPTDYLHP